MPIKYVPTTKETPNVTTEVMISDGEYMLYEMLNELIKELQRQRTRK